MLSPTDVYSVHMPEAVQKIFRLGALLRVERDELLARRRESVRRLPLAAALDTPVLSQVFQNLLSNPVRHNPRRAHDGHDARTGRGRRRVRSE